MEFNHKPIMVKECINMLQVKPDGIYVDCTLGGGGHSWEIVNRLSEKGLLLGIDRDIEAINASKARLKELNKDIRFVHSNFYNIKDVIHKNIGSKVDGILLDLGVSSYQLDNYDRGFSYQADALLDMRMDREQELTAEKVVNEYDKNRLSQIIYSYGEEKWTKRIVDFITEHRKINRIKTTGELTDIIKKAIPASVRRDGPHPAKRTFQAIRIEVNNELNILEDTIKDGIECLKDKGRICIITFHSLEDRIVKKTFSLLEGRCVCPPDFPICTCGNQSYGKILTKKPIKPSEEEIVFNPRARSSKLRVFERK